MSITFKLVCILVINFICYCESHLSEDVLLSGPGLHPDKIVMPARYFFVNFTLLSNGYEPSLGDDLSVEISGVSYKKPLKCRIWVNKLDRKDGSFIVRYKLYETCKNLNINVYYKSKHVSGSPIEVKGPVLDDNCNCPHKDFEQWRQDYGCPDSYEQIENDLKIFNDINMDNKLKNILDDLHVPESNSFCNYVVKDNEVHRKCYGKHVGFKMFADNILLSLTRKVVLPDFELVINLGDWPLSRKDKAPLPIFSWCGSDNTYDIVMPTYDITESTLENMGRVSLDMLSVQGGAARGWAGREERVFWRGRDSRAERLALVDAARAHPDLFNVSITNFFFFRDKEAQYGPKQPHVSFFKFFDYKYQMSIDGTVAAYRLPYLLAGGSLVLKQESPYYEHFYKRLAAWEHYVPVQRALGDVVAQVRWARAHDADARRIAENARRLANEHLLPQHVLCYHAVLFKEWSRRVSSAVRVRAGMERAAQEPAAACACQPLRDEL